jgi:CheY-like chemotaxis protein
VPVFFQFDEDKVILVADDSPFNLEALKLNLVNIGMHENAKYFADGQKVIDEVMATLARNSEGQWPVYALILDFKMPIKNGLEVVKEVKDIFTTCRKEGRPELKDPIYIFVSAFSDSNAFKKHC